MWIDTTTIGWQFTVYGQVYSVRAFRSDFLAQAPKAKEPLTGSLRTNVSVWYSSRRQDLDCAAEQIRREKIREACKDNACNDIDALVYDLMQEAGLIENDRQIIEKHEYGHMDAANPRVEILIEKI